MISTRVCAHSRSRSFTWICYVMDCGYLGFERLNRLHQAGSFFVTCPESSFTCTADTPDPSNAAPD